ncbi:cytochrome P450 [Cyathus striatus]|nr:cytochrome P450 [Cyathus striatus]
MLSLLTISYGIAGLALLGLIKSVSRAKHLGHIPTIGYSSPLFKILDSIRIIWYGRDIIQHGYNVHRNGVFKLSTLDTGWVVVLNGQKNVDAVRKARRSQLSLMKRGSELFQLDYTIGKHITENPYHLELIGRHLMRNTERFYPHIQDEVTTCFSALVPSNSEDWTTLGAFSTSIHVISRISARIFVGLPLSRNNEYCDMTVQIAMEITKGRLLHYVPVAFRPLAAKLISDANGIVKRTAAILEPTLRYRETQERLHGPQWPGKPDDLISWLLDEATGEERTTYNISMRVLLTSFVSTHTTAMVLTHALYDLLIRPSLLNEIRAEITRAFDRGKWTKESISELHLCDSFIREILRYHGISGWSMPRYVLDDFILPDGRIIPAGNFIAVNAWGTHRDEENYSSPHEFDPYRFLEADGSQKIISTMPTLEYLAFGHGRTVCPGRLYAVAELKIILAHMLCNFDIKLEDGQTTRPDNEWIESDILPNRNAKIMIRERSII